MRFWKDVLYDTQRGMSVEDAISLNAKLRDRNISAEEKEKASAIAEADIKLNSMP